MSRDDEFLSRWSRRKQDARKSESAPSKVENPAEPPEAAGEADERDEAELLAELGLKDPDEMTGEDDFSVFMQAAIPAKLRNRALRRLWRSNPTLANLDNLVDYGEDFTDTGLAGGVLATAYKIGRGFRDELVGGETESADDAAEPPPAEAKETAAPETAGESPQEPAEEPAEAELGERVAESGQEAPPRHSRQRMKFRF